MNLEMERSRNTVVSRADASRDAITRAASRIQRWFGGADQKQLKRESDLRSEELRRERERIVHELHDTLFQGFLGASLQIHDAVDRMPADSPSKPSLNRALRLMHRAIDEGRETLQGLQRSGIGSSSLEQELSGLRDEFMPCGGVRFRIFVKGQSKAVNPTVQEQISMIGREALANALRHSKATNIEAEIEYAPRRLRLVIRDNGCGIDPQVLGSGRHAHWGLVGMRERAGSIGAQLRIWSRPGAGTEVEISVPDKMAAAACA